MIGGFVSPQTDKQTFLIAELLLRLKSEIFIFSVTNAMESKGATLRVMTEAPTLVTLNNAEEVWTSAASCRRRG